ncbi:glucosamine-6-phosphate deaminase [Flavimobilis marinus]|uniref:Glucosamine-6-phosphate deaminase n=1 Tax=Flavimobilis marinus TaxID=285351 RepID=A0A1I2I3E4_9MICO|nr:glucosamine-6-phosphate deaminase [Flavimobilis marinus]GHG48416.1 glucosamine-6-phosphate deaminase [Flavimobilis marinus]SFF35607.1 glucosamine-6-phosphate deaminase [Flavimobilis marinus]
MEIVILPSEAEIARHGADVVARVLAGRDRPVLGLATGSSPLPVYGELIRRHREEGMSFAHAEAFLLDEYVGLPAGHPESYREVIRRELTSHVDLEDAHVHGPDGSAADVARAAREYDDAIAAAGGVDVQLLGIGTDGHVAFNEPGSSLASRTRVKTLTEQTRRDNARFFDSLDDVPWHVLTQGLGTIREARHLLLVATGEGKADAVAGMVEGPVSAFCPASVLQLHPHVTVLLDDAAASRLRLADYYRHAFAHKPTWQSL